MLLMSAAVVAVSLDQFNGASTVDARSLLGACPDIERWVVEVDAGRPYATVQSLQDSASDSADRITWAEVAGALLRHPRIGETAIGDPGDVALSAAEQSGVAQSDAEALAAGNLAYERHFGYIYLICASGLSGEQMLEALRERLNHDDEQERLVVMDELRKIAALRLSKAVAA